MKTDMTEMENRAEAAVSAAETAENGQEKPKKKSQKGTVVGIIFLVIVTVFTLVILFQFNDFGATMREVGKVNGFDMLFAALCLLGYILIWPVGLVILCRGEGSKSGMLECYLAGASEHFFNGVTPYQTGAQPFQVYELSRSGDRPGRATGLVIMNYIAFEIAFNIMVFASLIFAPRLFENFEPATMWIPIVGIVMNFLTLVIFICIATTKWMRNFFVWCMTLLCRIKIVDRFLGKQIHAFEQYCDNAQMVSKQILAHVPRFIAVVITKLIGLAFYYIIPFFILRALGIDPGAKDFVYSAFAACFAITAVVFIPTPGTSGGIEYAFIVVFATLGMTDATAAAGALIWRGLTYYILLIVSFLEYVALEIILRIKEKKKLMLEESGQDAAVGYEQGN